jgi:hypothetical protein
MQWMLEDAGSDSSAPVTCPSPALVAGERSSTSRLSPDDLFNRWVARMKRHLEGQSSVTGPLVMPRRVQTAKKFPARLVYVLVDGTITLSGDGTSIGHLDQADAPEEI